MASVHDATILDHDDAPAEPGPTGPSKADESWWTAESHAAATEPTDAEWEAIYQARDEVFPFDFDAWVESQEGRFEPEPIGPSEETWQEYGAAVSWTETYERHLSDADDRRDHERMLGRDRFQGHDA